MYIIYILLSLALGFALSGILFGITIVLSNTRAKAVGQFLMPIISIIPVIILLIITRRNIFNLYNLFDGISWVILIITNTIVIMLITLNSSNLLLSRKAIFVNGLEGLMMEIPQRILMQNFIFSLLSYWKINNSDIWCILINANIWCLGILVQALIMKRNLHKALFTEILSSFIFSIGIGYVFMRTELILLPMIAHFAERIISKGLNVKISYKNISE